MADSLGEVVLALQGVSNDLRWYARRSVGDEFDRSQLDATADRLDYEAELLRERVKLLRRAGGG